MIHVLIKQSEDSKYPVLAHFGSVNELNSFYRDKIPGEVIANKKDLEKALKDNKANNMVTTMLERVNQDELADVECDIESGICIVKPAKPESKSEVSKATTA